MLQHSGKINSQWKIDLASESIVFETEPEDALPNLWYESDAAYPIDVATGNHLGSYASNPAFPTVLRCQTIKIKILVQGKWYN